MFVSADELPKQGFMGIGFDWNKVTKVVNSEWRTDKPEAGGLWTSPVRENGLTEWQIWCKREMPQWFNESVTIVEPESDMVIFKVDDWSDLDWLWGKFGIANFEAASKEIDAIWFTEYAVRGCRHDLARRGYDLCATDIESVLWFKK